MRQMKPELPRFEMATVTLASKMEKKVPALYRVFLLNDDYTPMDFVTEVLQRYFGMDSEIATATMLRVHQGGKAVCGLYTKEIAETRVAEVNEFSRRNQYPLLCRMEETGNQ